MGFESIDFIMKKRQRVRANVTGDHVALLRLEFAASGETSMSVWAKEREREPVGLRCWGYGRIVRAMTDETLAPDVPVPARRYKARRNEATTLVPIIHRIELPPEPSSEIRWSEPVPICYGADAATHTAPSSRATLHETISDLIDLPLLDERRAPGIVWVEGDAIAHLNPGDWCQVHRADGYDIHAFIERLPDLNGKMRGKTKKVHLSDENPARRRYIRI